MRWADPATATTKPQVVVAACHTEPEEAPALTLCPRGKALNAGVEHHR